MRQLFRHDPAGKHEDLRTVTVDHRKKTPAAAHECTGNLIFAACFDAFFQHGVSGISGGGKSGQASVICLTDDNRKAVSEVALAKGGAADAKKIEGSDQSGDKSALTGKNELYGGAEGNGVVILRYKPITE